MKTASVIFSTLLLLTSTSQTFAQPVKGSDVVLEALTKSAVMINLPQTQACGSGILFERGKYLATSIHVLGVGINMDVDRRDYEEIEYTAKFGPVAMEPLFTQQKAEDQDVLVIRSRLQDFDGKLAPPRGYGIDRYVRFRDLEKGMRLWTCGNRNCKPFTVTSGRIKLLYTEDLGIDVKEEWGLDIKKVGSHSYERLILTENTLAGHGNSGGPVVDEHGRLAGMVFARSKESVVVIPIEYIFDTINLSEPRTSKVD